MGLHRRQRLALAVLAAVHVRLVKADPPTEWVPRIVAANMVWAPNDTTVEYARMPIIGNGFIAYQLCSSVATSYTNQIYAAGVYDGAVSNRAMIPAGLAALCVPAPGPIPADTALDIERATYYRRSFVDPATPGSCTTSSASTCTNANERLIIEQRLYAHRALPSLMVMEVEVIGQQPYSGSGPYAMLSLTNAGTSGPGPHINFTQVPPASLPVPPFTIHYGWTQTGELNNSALLHAVAILSSNLTNSGTGSNMWPIQGPNTTLTFFTVVRTSIETEPDQLVNAVQADYAVAARLAQEGTLHSTHVGEWRRTVWTSGFEVDRLDVAIAANVSLYAIMSSVRSDRPYSLSPGGLGSDAYEGHSFWGECDRCM